MTGARIRDDRRSTQRPVSGGPHGSEGREGDSAIEREGLKLAQDMPLKEQVIFTGSTDWSPDQAEHYIDWRIQCIDTDIARLRQQLDDLIASRKRWLAVTGGRSKVFANGNGHAAASIA